MSKWFEKHAAVLDKALDACARPLAPDLLFPDQELLHAE